MAEAFSQQNLLDNSVWCVHQSKGPAMLQTDTRLLQGQWVSQAESLSGHASQKDQSTVCALLHLQYASRSMTEHNAEDQVHTVATSQSFEIARSRVTHQSLGSLREQRLKRHPAQHTG